MVMKKYYKLVDELNDKCVRYVSSCLPMPIHYDGWKVIECSNIEYECNKLHSLAWNIRIDLKYTHVVTYEQYFSIMRWILNGAKPERRK